MERALRVYFSSQLSVQDAENPVQFRAQMLLLHDDSETKDKRVDRGNDGRCVTVHQVLVGVSDAAYVTQLAVILDVWNETGTNPLLPVVGATEAAEASTPTIEGVTREFTSRERVSKVSIDILHALITVIKRGVEEASLVATTLFVDEIGGSRGLLTLLGFQQTAGSRNVAPLTLGQCLAAFTQRHTPSEPLTVGARAFSKHCARSLNGWWGQLKGNDAAKNACAVSKVRELLATATWKNVHSLPHAHATMEIRNALGYGARWDAETQAFRGLLEPPMVNGHEIKWRH